MSGSAARKRMVTTVDSHTAGHPTRVVTGGLPPLHGFTVAERSEDFRARFDDLRTFLLHEPRGHAAMVGAVLTESSRADFGAFFLGSYKYLEMCGHATIGLAVTLDHLGLVGPGPDGTARFSLEVPAGLVAVSLVYEEGAVSRVSFDNVPAYLVAQDVGVEVEGRFLAADIAYGGNWYALMDARAAGVTLSPAGVSEALTRGAAVKRTVNALIAAGRVAGVAGPVDSVLFYDAAEDAEGLVSRQLVVLESNKFDRSPCGTGTSARLAQLIGRNQLAPGQPIRSRNILGIDFLASATRIEPDGTGRPRIRPSVSGLAHITGLHTFLSTAGDPLPAGFLCR